MREKNPPFMTRRGRFAAYFERVVGAAIIAASVLLVAPAMASEQATDDSFSIDSGVHVNRSHILNDIGLVELTSADLDSVRGAGLLPEGQLDFGSGQQIGVILWDELKRNKLGGQDGGSSVTVNNLPSDVTVNIITY